MFFIIIFSCPESVNWIIILVWENYVCGKEQLIMNALHALQESKSNQNVDMKNTKQNYNYNNSDTLWLMINCQNFTHFIHIARSLLSALYPSIAHQ